VNFQNNFKNQNNHGLKLHKVKNMYFLKSVIKRGCNRL